MKRRRPSGPVCGDCGRSRWRTLAKGIAYLCRSCRGVRSEIAGRMMSKTEREPFLRGAAAVRGGMR